LYHDGLSSIARRVKAVTIIVLLIRFGVTYAFYL
jgi:hypothetical protein